MSASPTSTRQDEILDELSELGLALARKVQARALAAADETDDAQLCDLAAAFHRIARSVRQTLALKDRLERSRKADARQACDDELGGYVARNMLRKGQVRAAVVRSLRQAYEHEDEYEALLPALDDAVHEASLLDADFLDGPFDAVVSRIRADLGVAAGAVGGADWRGSG